MSADTFSPDCYDLIDAVICSSALARSCTLRADVLPHIVGDRSADVDLGIGQTPGDQHNCRSAAIVIMYLGFM